MSWDFNEYGDWCKMGCPEHGRYQSKDYATPEADCRERRGTDVSETAVAGETMESTLTMLSMSINEATGYIVRAFGEAKTYADLRRASLEATRIHEMFEQERAEAWMINLERVLPKLRHQAQECNKEEVQRHE